jgi:septal ring factor EnvC (AmiA/AmiB activator)
MSAEDIREIRAQAQKNAADIAVTREKVGNMGEKQEKMEAAVSSVAANVGTLTGAWKASDARLARLVEDNDDVKQRRLDAIAAQEKADEENALWWAKLRREITPANLMMGTVLIVILLGFLRGEYSAAEALDKAAHVGIPTVEQPAPAVEELAP